MPLYDFHCVSCDHSFEKMLKIVDCDLPTTEPCPNCSKSEVKKSICAPAICDPVRLGVKRPPADFQKYVLGRIKNDHKLGNVERNSTIPREI
jgi:putative FmdB family regulatory protein